jgi:hypothetical protein
MAESAAEDVPETVRLVNRRDRPVELHCGGEAIVVPPLGSLDLPARLLEAPQIGVLLRRRVLVARTAAPADDPSDGGASPAKDSASAKIRRKGAKAAAGTVAADPD